MQNNVQGHRNATVCKQTYDASCTAIMVWLLLLLRTLTSPQTCSVEHTTTDAKGLYEGVGFQLVNTCLQMSFYRLLPLLTEGAQPESFTYLSHSRHHSGHMSQDKDTGNLCPMSL